MVTNLRLGFVVLITVVIAACGTNRENDTAQEDAGPLTQTDITRPPVFVKRETTNVESNPDETISMEEWQKQQQQNAE